MILDRVLYTDYSLVARKHISTLFYTRFHMIIGLKQCLDKSVRIMLD